MSTSQRFTTADLELLPDQLDDTRYELIDGELSVAKQPHWEHQFTAGQLVAAWQAWSRQTRRGVANICLLVQRWASTSSRRQVAAATNVSATSTATRPTTAARSAQPPHSCILKAAPKSTPQKGSNTNPASCWAAL